MPPSHLIQILSFAERQNEYDSQEEFWVTVKETGKKIESTSSSEIQTQEREAPIL
jgi:transcriptional regulator GlxA family with amidase domain